MKPERLSDGTLPKVTWPGCYPLFYFDKDNEILCPECANKEPAENIVAVEVLWEEGEYCAECSRHIECAYPKEEQTELPL